MQLFFMYKKIYRGWDKYFENFEKTANNPV